MSNESNVTAEVTRLRQYLFDVWNWDALFAIAEERQGLNLSSEPYEQGHREEADAIAESLNAHLSERLNEAVTEADAVLKDLVPGPARNAQVGGLLESLRALQQPGACWRQWTERGPHRYAEQQDAEQREGAPTPADAWAGVESDVHRYVAALVEHIEGHSAEVEAGAPQPLNRLEWTCSTEVYVHLVRELMQRGYITLPSMNGKLGEGNVTEVFRRLSQAFILSKKNGEELTAEALQRRYNGNLLPEGKRAKLTLPEAKEVK